jgi:hypothetical protein
LRHRSELFDWHKVGIIARTRPGKGIPLIEQKDKAHFVAMYSSARDLMRKTPDFWDGFVHVKLNRDFGGMHRFLNDPFPNGPNHYLERIEANMRRLRKQEPGL